MAALSSREPATQDSRAAFTRATSDRRRRLPIALVTGSSTGIGLATAVTLARAGHTVYATMRNPAKGSAEIAGIAQAENLPITVLQLDVDSDESVREAFSRTGPLDVLVNNAG